MAPRDSNRDGANGSDELKVETSYATLATIRYDDVPNMHSMHSKVMCAVLIAIAESV